ncbi:CoB--CoM heterodisulfide reductase iron-sulfur subunit A family protein [uncultured Desulfobacterium sp.]|uniref:CoB--CoM heterodisulfide reductase iron-sulfur subunit A family protein n=1 Tax=uncultured Desulfobacterium sp. TaxID=201089 RepID=A0A445N140_9BACT|nr:CoB--CoM heterodisulfide reductase iron-sulfur subunit A family protein [uncultured Desulfobacterium sp.]
MRKDPRYIDLSKCTACGDCAKVCPVSLPNEYDQGLSDRKATYKKYAQSIPGAFAIHKTDKAPCRLACPAGLNVQGYVQMVKEGKYEQALKIIMEDLPLPGVLGRICPHGCEDACRRCDVDKPVAIRNLKRLAADQFDPRKISIECLPLREEKAAIIGSGPAGLSAAYHLAKKGIRSTIFEALPEAGGMLRVGIPDHRLPRHVLDREIEIITGLGVEIKLNSPLGPNLTVDNLLADGYKAVYIAVGAHKGIELGVPGEKAEGVRQGVDFLRELNLTGNAKVGKRVAIIGGGNVAIDVARSAVRLKAEEVNIIYRRTRAEMPAWEEEIKAAEEEGVKITYLSAPQEIIAKDGKVCTLRCIRMELGEPDSSGRRRPVPIPGSEYDLEIDQLIPAIGQRPDLSSIEDVMGIKFSRWGTVDVDPITYATGREGVFAGGDAQTGPWVAIGAIAAGREAAESIVRYLDGRDMAEGRQPISKENPVYRPIPVDIPKKDRARMPELSPAERKGNFNEMELGYDEDTGKAEADRCLNCGYCCECFQCVENCKAGAVTSETHKEQSQLMELNVGSIILSAGFKPFDPSRFDTYSYAKHQNVMTAMEFERILSASGPTMGHLVRMSDHKEPKKIAWLQCVGSRDLNRCDHGYCSSVCCMYATKEAVIAKEHAGPDIDCAIFFMDMRTFGKDFEDYYDRAREKYGVRYIRSRVHTIDPVAGTDDLLLKYATEEGEFIQEQFDMVVLSVGIETPPEVERLAERLGVELNSDKFCKTGTFQPVTTSKEGIYVCGAFQGPKDIPSSVTEASAAACAASIDLAAARGTEIRTVKVPDEIDVSEQEPRIGVFVCNCGTNIGGVVDVASVVEYASSLPHVVYADQNLFTCAQDTQDRMKDVIREKGLNRMVVAACSPTTHEPLFQDTLKSCGLNPYLFEMANIRNHNSWVHGDNALAATEKAKDLVRMSVARASLLTPLKAKKLSINKRALVIGGGVSGMSAALSLGNQGFEVVLVEKEPHLGGLSRELTKTIEGDDVQELVVGLIENVTHNKNIQVLTESLIVGFSGFKGNFTTEVLVGPAMYERKIDHGVVVLATGATEYSPTEFSYGADTRIITQIEMGKRLEEEGASDLKNVVMIQCVGSRNEDFSNCSRVCCQTAIKNALHIKAENPDANVYILYRDIRAYGLLENYYREARREGVVFFRFNKEVPPQVEITDEGVIVTFKDHVLQRDLMVTADALVLSAGVRPQDTDELANILKLARNQHGYFMEAHVKLRPVDTPSEGIFVCGTAHSPKLISESISQSLAAASRAATFLSQTEITLSVVTAKVDQQNCASCLVCVRSCPYGVPKINKDGVSEIDEALCRGCGICAAECPAKVIQLNWYEDDQVMSKVEALLEGVL